MAFGRGHEEILLAFPFLYIHAAVDCRDLPGITERFNDAANVRACRGAP